MSAHVPAAYANAKKLGVEGRAVLACTREVWDALTVREREILMRAEKDGKGNRYAWTGRLADRERLTSRGLIEPASEYRVTPLGELVRQVGLHVVGSGPRRWWTR